MKKIVILFIGIIFTSCTTVKYTENTEPLASDGFDKPTEVVGELVLSVTNARVLEGEELRQHNISKGLPENTPAAFRVWSAAIRNRLSQRNTELLNLSEPPDKISFDKINQNKIYYWNLLSKLKTRDSVIISRKFKYVTYQFNAELNNGTDISGTSGLSMEEYQYFTKSERFLEQTNEIKKAARRITDGISTPYNKAKLIHEFVNKEMKYVYPPEKRGVRYAFETMKGDCGQYGYLFVTMVRALGIPARMQNGFYFSDAKTGYHVWCEIFLPYYGWLPVDPTVKNGFLKLDNKRLIASNGTNIPLDNVPEWATFSNSEADENSTDLMQLCTIVINGVIADITTKRIIHKYEIK